MNRQTLTRIATASFVLTGIASQAIAQSPTPPAQPPSSPPAVPSAQMPLSAPPPPNSTVQPAPMPPTVSASGQTPPNSEQANRTAPTASGQATNSAGESLLDDVVKGFGEGFATAIVVVVGAAAATAKLTALWDMRKKRNELDIALARDFYKLVGAFKAIAREGSALGAKPTRPTEAVLRWVSWHDDLTRRAIQTESDMEALLLNLVSEGVADEGLEPAARLRRLRAAGLLRVAFRNLREQITGGHVHPPGFADPLFWLMDRIEGELSRHIFARATRIPRSYALAAPPVDPTDFLTLISYRTTDLEIAAARLGPDVENYILHRGNARDQRRQANARALFPANLVTVALVPRDDPNLPMSLARVSVVDGQTTAIVVTNAKLFVSDLDAVAYAAFQFHASLVHFVIVGDHLDLAAPPGAEHSEIQAVYVRSLGAPHTLCRANQHLPKNLPLRPAAELTRAGIRLPPRGADLLAWSADDVTKRALRDIGQAYI